MTLVARIRATRTQRQVGARNPHAVISPGIDTHIKLAGHVAIDTGAPRRSDLMPMVRGVVVVAGQMALGTDPIPFRHQLVAVRIVAVGAGHTSPVHFALNERTVDIYLVTNLPIGPVERGLNHRQTVSVQ